MSVHYDYDYVCKDVLIRQSDDEPYPEILHKGDKCWNYLKPGHDPSDEGYSRAIYLGQGCWEDLKAVDEKEVHQILQQWGYTEDPPKDE